MEDFILMKNNIKHLFSLLIFSMILIGCQREKIVIQELAPEHKIAVHCYLDGDSSKEVVCKVYKSIQVFGNTNSENYPILDAVVEIGNNGNWFKIPSSIENQDYRAILPEGFLKDNSIYQLRISHPEFPTAESSISLLPKYTTEDISGKVELINSETDSTFKLKYSISWADDSRSTNYYRVLPQVGYINVDFPTDTFYMPPNYGKIFMLNESNKKGNRIMWQTISDFYPFGENGFKPVSIKIYVLNTDKIYHDYHHIITLMNSEGTIAEPSFFKGNIKNAFGVFAACNGLSEKTFPLE
jgi:hypothetical protein